MFDFVEPGQNIVQEGINSILQKKKWIFYVRKKHGKNITNYENITIIKKYIDKNVGFFITKFESFFYKML